MNREKIDLRPLSLDRITTCSLRLQGRIQGGFPGFPEPPPPPSLKKTNKQKVKINTLMTFSCAWKPPLSLPANPLLAFWNPIPLINFIVICKNILKLRFFPHPHPPTPPPRAPLINFFKTCKSYE